MKLSAVVSDAPGSSTVYATATALFIVAAKEQAK